MDFDDKLDSALEAPTIKDRPGPPPQQKHDTPGPGPEATIHMPAMAQLTPIIYSMDQAIKLLDPFRDNGIGGTPDFIAPEQARGVGRFDVDGITNLYYTLSKTEPKAAAYVLPLAIKFQSMMKAYDQLATIAHNLQSVDFTNQQPQPMKATANDKSSSDTVDNDFMSLEDRNVMSQRLDQKSFKKIAFGVAALKKASSELGKMSGDPKVGKQIDQFLLLFKDFLANFLKLAPLLAKFMNRQTYVQPIS